MSGIDITDYVRVQSICAGNGIVLENKLRENQKKEIKVKNTQFDGSFLEEFLRVDSERKKNMEKTAK